MASDLRCRRCGRPGVSVAVPVGFVLPAGESVLILCRWHRGADTRRAADLSRRLDPITAGFAEVQAACDRILAENERSRQSQENSDSGLTGPTDLL